MGCADSSLCRRTLAAAVALTAACTAEVSVERAVTAVVTIGVEGDTLCLAAGDGETLGFVSAYDVAGLPDPATLTFLPGPASSVSLHLVAFVTEGGALRGRAAVALAVPDGLTEATLAVRRCTPGAPGGFGARPGGGFAVLAASPRMVGADLDGDGADELLAVAADSSLAVLRAVDPAAGSRRETELVTDGHVAAIGDLDGDCRIDLVATSSLGALLVYGPTGRTPPPVGPVVLAAAVGSVRAPGERAVVLASDTGLDLVTFPGSGTAVTHVATGVFSHVTLGRLDGDAILDVLAAGPAGAVVFLGGAPFTPLSTLPIEVAGGGGPVALADVDADGALDAIVVTGADLNVALGDGAGGFTSTLTATLDADVARIEAGDLDGNCTDDVVGITTSGRPFALTGAGGALADLGAPTTASIDVALLDADGDGTTELALLGAGGRITLWRP